MPILLTGTGTHLSIKPFEATKIEDFSIITGPNGAGKTQLLEAIQRGLVTVSLDDGNGMRELPVQDRAERAGDPSLVVLLDNVNNRIESRFGGNGEIEAKSLTFAAQQPRLRVQIAKEGTYGEIVYRNGLDKFTPVWMRYLPDDPAIIDMVSAEDYPQLHQLHQQNYQYWLMRTQKDYSLTVAEIRSLEVQFGKPVWALDPETEIPGGLGSFGRVDFLRLGLAEMIEKYKEIERQAAMAAYDAGGTLDVDAHRASMRKQLGPNPRELIDEVLEAAGLDFRVASVGKGSISFKKPGVDSLIPFHALSSGEKVILSFCLISYYAEDRRQLMRMPTVLLLDEIDASLHPSMVGQLLNVLNNVFVKKYGVKVILTTHSPSTVALARDAGIYVMAPGVQGITLSTRDQALKVLLEGVPSISIDFSGRRQVFVEDPFDARMYGSIYKYYAAQFTHDRSLEFIATGANGDNCGAARVKIIMAELVKSNNRSVLALLDWDGSNAGKRGAPVNSRDVEKRLFVIGEGVRDGFESIILDPLLLAAYIARNIPEHCHLIEMDPASPAHTFNEFDDERLQRIINLLTKAIFGDEVEKMAVSYGKRKVRRFLVDKRLTDIDDHDYAELVRQKLPKLINPLSKGGQNLEYLYQDIIDTVLRDSFDFAPTVLMNAFDELLNADL